MIVTGKRILILTAAIAAAAIIGACSKQNTQLGFNASADGLALEGYDAVAYFVVGSAAKGDPRFKHVWNGVTWYFSSEENMKTFQAEPERYAPQYGGYCSYAVSEGYTADGDPEAWKIVDGKLYLNYNMDVKATWEKKQSERIENANKNWEAFKTKPPVKKG
ncbi:MAG: YHS domain-containing protein [Acidobacteria bacterium]|nr:YHS domain-containing protein [Acidobacteriota bacterium]